MHKPTVSVRFLALGPRAFTTQMHIYNAGAHVSIVTATDLLCTRFLFMRLWVAAGVLGATDAAMPVATSQTHQTAALIAVLRAARHLQLVAELDSLVQCKRALGLDVEQVRPDACCA